MNSKHRIISIIIPVYNTEAYFERCMQSVLDQTYQNLQIIVVNDCSPGDIDARIAPYLERDSRICYLRHEKNRGLLRARVTGLTHAIGDYIAFLDSDDYVSRDFYRTMLNRAVQTNADIVIGKTVWQENDNKYVYNLHDSCFRFQALEADAVRQAYFSQEASCYSWHTVWNKLYSRELVARCYPVFERISDHIIMTEDIFFSSVFFYEAQKAVRVEEEAYFYCSNESASTNTSQITLEKFLKNIADMQLVFNAVDTFLRERNADAGICAHFNNSRKHYARMWQNLLDISFKGTKHLQGQAALKKFCPDYTLDHVRDDFFFESIRTPWNGVLEYFKERIATGPEEFISFDIFDTLILRPFYEPEDLLKLLDPLYHSLTGSQASFYMMRRMGEQLARQEHYQHHPNHQDITLTEIYECIGRSYGLDEELIRRMYQEEIRLELRFCEPRCAGKSLFDMALAAGKKVLLVTDMYLEKETIEQILQKNGYTGYDRLYVSSYERQLKYSGDLFRCVLRDYPNAEGNTIHIGDTWKSDIEGSQKIGFEQLFLPKTREFYENRIDSYFAGGCATLADRICGTFIDRSKLRRNLGLRTMLAIASEKYFDRPYRSFLPGSDMNADPWFIGYHLVGMHLMGLCKWIDSQLRTGGYQTIHFLSRDGYLPMKAYEIYSRYVPGAAKISYLQTSRKALLPVIASDPVSFYQLPVEFRAHTPMSLIKLLSFACAVLPDQKKRSVLKEHQIDPDAYIADEAQYVRFISCFIEHFYDETIHSASRKAAEQYFSQIKSGDVAFDMGYSGRIQAAISKACGHGVDVLFLHEDYDKSVRMKKLSGFDVTSFYDFRPMVSGLFREHLLSDCAGSCIGYCSTLDGAIPVIEDTVKRCTDSFVVNSIQSGALEFVSDYLQRFSDILEDLDYSALEVSLPLEGFMRHPSAADLQIFCGSYFEDEVYGGRTELNIEEFLRNQTEQLDCVSVQPHASAPIDNGPSFIDVITPKPQWLRAIIWLLVDFKSFKDRLKLNLTRIFKKK